jgi:hypothetical protein
MSAIRTDAGSVIVETMLALPIVMLTLWLFVTLTVRAMLMIVGLHDQFYAVRAASVQGGEGVTTLHHVAQPLGAATTTGDNPISEGKSP